MVTLYVLFALYCIYLLGYNFNKHKHHLVAEYR